MIFFHLLKLVHSIVGHTIINQFQFEETFLFSTILFLFTNQQYRLNYLLCCRNISAVNKGFYNFIEYRIIEKQIETYNNRVGHLIEH